MTLMRLVEYRETLMQASIASARNFRKTSARRRRSARWPPALGEPHLRLV